MNTRNRNGGDGLDDMGEYWRDLKAAQQQKRSSNRATSTDLLTRAGVTFETKNNGVHLICRNGDVVADFWPSTGLYIIRNTQRKGRGVRNLIQLMTPRSTP